MFVRIALLLIAAVFAVAVAAHRSSGAGPEHRYLVKPGDSLWSIATTHYPGDPREGVWKIEHRNELAGATIQPGERLVLPAG
jgi:polar amino acid transport system substrate-binding protein